MTKERGIGDRGGVLAVVNGRTRTGEKPESTTRIKERLKARLFAFLKKKSGLRNKRLNHKPNSNGGGGNVENNLIGSGFRVRAIVIVSQRAIPRLPAT